MLAAAYGPSAVSATILSVTVDAMTCEVLGLRQLAVIFLGLPLRTRKPMPVSMLPKIV